MQTFKDFVNQCLVETGVEDPFAAASNIERRERLARRYKRFFILSPDHCTRYDVVSIRPLSREIVLAPIS